MPANLDQNTKVTVSVSVLLLLGCSLFTWYMKVEFGALTNNINTKQAGYEKEFEEAKKRDANVDQTIAALAAKISTNTQELAVIKAVQDRDRQAYQDAIRRLETTVEATARELTKAVDKLDNKLDAMSRAAPK